MWWPSENGPPGTIYPDSSFDVAAVPVAPGTNTLTATYTGPAFTNVPMTATDTSTVVLGDTAYTHDANGNLTGDATFLYQYDLANQLTNVIRKSDSAVVLQCRYDALGRRVEAIRSDGTVDRYVYFPGSFLVLAVLDENNAPKELYTRGPDLSGTLSSAGGIGGILACTYSSGPVLYHHADLMGNIIALTDSLGGVASTFRYTPFGQFSVRTGSIISRHLFSSKEFDSSANLYYYGYRYYSSPHHRWLTRDHIKERRDPNLYRFVLGNPIAYLDFLGLAASKDGRVVPNMMDSFSVTDLDCGNKLYCPSTECQILEKKYFELKTSAISVYNQLQSQHRSLENLANKINENTATVLLLGGTHVIIEVSIAGSSERPVSLLEYLFNKLAELFARGGKTQEKQLETVTHRLDSLIAETDKLDDAFLQLEKSFAEQGHNYRQIHESLLKISSDWQSKCCQEK